MTKSFVSLPPRPLKLNNIGNKALTIEVNQTEHNGLFNPSPSLSLVRLYLRKFCYFIFKSLNAWSDGCASHPNPMYWVIIKAPDALWGKKWRTVSGCSLPLLTSEKPCQLPWTWEFMLFVFYQRSISSNSSMPLEKVQKSVIP